MLHRLRAVSYRHYTKLENMIREHLSPLFPNASVIEQAPLSAPNATALGAVFHFLWEYLNNPQIMNDFGKIAIILCGWRISSKNSV